ncbi:MAG: hypothetical protein WBY44_27410 [Bryobacteraceae bacterium]
MAHKNRNIGSISSGTMRSEDLIPTFIYELKRQRPMRRQHKQLVRDVEQRMESDDYYSGDDASDDLESLFDALGEYAPEHFYFGSHVGDGADYGFWLCESWEEQLQDDGGIKVDGIEEIPADHIGDVAIIGDHGNVSLYRRGRNHHLHEVWSVV